MWATKKFVREVVSFSKCLRCLCSCIYGSVSVVERGGGGSSTEQLSTNADGRGGSLRPDPLQPPPVPPKGRLLRLPQRGETHVILM